MTTRKKNCFNAKSGFARKFTPLRQHGGKGEKGKVFQYFRRVLYICYLFKGSSTYYNLLVFKVFSSNHLKNTLILLFPVAYGGSLLQYAKLTEYSSEITRRISFISFFFSSSLPFLLADSCIKVLMTWARFIEDRF